MLHTSIFRSLLLAAAFSLIFSACKDDPETPTYEISTTLTPIGNELAIPLHDVLVAETGTLRTLAQNFAGTPDSANLTAFRSQLEVAHVAWKACEPFVFGDAKNQFLHNRIGKWPTNPTQIETILAGTDVLDDAFIDRQGSTARGLYALEYLVFFRSIDSTVYYFTNDAGATRRTDYLTGLCTNLEQKATGLRDFWSPSGGNYATDWANSTAVGSQHPMDLIVNELSSLLEEVAKDKIGTPLGKFNFDVPQPERIETPYGSYSLKLARENVRVLHEIFNGPNGAGGIDDALDALEAQYNGQPLSTAIDAEFTTLETELAAIPEPLEEAIFDAAATLEAAYQTANDLLVLVRADLASALSVTIVPSDNDGD